MKKKIEEIFETALFACRFMTLLAVLGALFSAFAMFVSGTMQIISGISIFIAEVRNFHLGELHGGNDLVAVFVSSVDKYLFATVLLIFSMGLYELFISKIDPASRDEDTPPNWLQTSSLDELKGSLGKVILMILIVSFFEHSLNIEYKSASDLLFLGIGIVLVSGALFLTHANQKHGSH
jgi:uncharacterized membrane protein YqhA